MAQEEKAREVGEMREVREISERLGYARAKYEQTNTGEQPEVARHWAQEIEILSWVLGGDRVGLPVIAKHKEEEDPA